MLNDSEDQKLLTLAESSLQRNKVSQSAAVRDGIGRTHVGNAISMSSLDLDALQVALAMALSSGASIIEAAVVVGQTPSRHALENIREISPKASIWYVEMNGTVRAV